MSGRGAGVRSVRILGSVEGVTHDLAEERLREALRIAEVFGWSYHRATTPYSMAEARFRRLGRLDADGRAWLDEATVLCEAGGYAVWLAKAEALEAAVA